MKPIVIAGNGPSLKDIDYRRLPKEYDVFRCTQFFFEDKYYLGKEVTGFFMGHPTFQSLFNTSIVLESSNEYFFKDKYFSGLILDDSIYNREFLKYFWTAQAAFDIYSKHPQVSQFINNWFTRYGLYPTTGTIMILTAAALGYSEIYVTGIDFYDSKTELYAFDVEKANELNNKMVKGQGDKKSFQFSDPLLNPDSWHTEEIERAGIELVKNLEGVKIYSLTPDSKLSTILPLASLQNEKSYVPIEKSEGYLKDIVLTEQELREQEQREQEQREQEQREQEEQEQREQEQREQEQREQEQERNQGRKQKIKNIFIKKDLVGEWDFIRQYWLVRLIYQTIKLPYIILKIIIKLIK